jgi:glucose/arabinose dehydrogenase
MIHHSLKSLCSVMASASLFGTVAGCQTRPAQIGPSVQASPSAIGLGERRPNVPNFWVRSGYRVTLVGEGFGQARFLETDPSGTLYVSQPDKGQIIAMRPGSDGTYTEKAVFVTGYKTAHGMHVRDGWLWFTQSGAIHKARIDPANWRKPAEIVTVIPDGQLPKGGGHWWRAICVTDQYLFTSIGDDGNINDHRSDDREKVFRFNLDGTGKTEWSTGLRNTEKLRIRPGTTDLFGADHGSDNFGGPFGEKGGGPITDAYPPCEFNKYEQGKFYGHPFITGKDMPRIEFKDRPDILELAEANTAPAWSFGAHWAPNGWDFLKTAKLVDNAGDAVVAFHGSWNSRKKVGYCIEHIMFDPATGEVMGTRPLVKTNDGNNVMGRPCDIVELADGSILFSDDSRGRLYRLERLPITK